MSRVAKIREFVKQDLWTTDLDAVHWVRRVGIQSLRLAIAVAWEFRHRLLDARAAGLVFTTLLSLVPFLAVMFSVLKGFGVHNQFEPMLSTFLAPLGERGDEITRRILGFIENVNVGVLGAAGLGLLIYTVVSLMQKIEESFNFIWHVSHSRGFSERFARYLSVLLIGPLLVFSAMGITATVMNNAWVRSALEWRLLEPLTGLAGVLILIRVCQDAAS